MVDKNKLLILVSASVAFFFFSYNVLFATEGVSKVKSYNTGSVAVSSTKGAESNSQNGQELFNLYGKGSDCSCGSWDNSGKCTKYLSAEEKKECQRKHEFGGKGTFKMNGNLVVGGDLVLNGYDGNNNHWVKTGTEDDGASSVIGFNKDNGDLLVNNNTFLSEDLKVNDPEADINFGETGQTKIDFKSKGTYDTNCIIQTATTSIYSLPLCVPSITFQQNGVSGMELYQGTKSDYKVVLKNGLEIGNLKTDYVQHGDFLLKNEDFNYDGWHNLISPDYNPE